MPFLHLPEPGSAGVRAGSGVGDVKDIPQPGPVPGIVHQGDALGTAPDIAAHLVIPGALMVVVAGIAWATTMQYLHPLP